MTLAAVINPKGPTMRFREGFASAAAVVILIAAILAVLYRIRHTI